MTPRLKHILYILLGAALASLIWWLLNPKHRCNPNKVMITTVKFDSLHHVDSATRYMLNVQSQNLLVTWMDSTGMGWATRDPNCTDMGTLQFMQGPCTAVGPSITFYPLCAGATHLSASAPTGVNLQIGFANAMLSTGGVTTTPVYRQGDADKDLSPFQSIGMVPMLVDKNGICHPVEGIQWAGQQDADGNVTHWAWTCSTHDPDNVMNPITITVMVN